ncbi:hypothetical protein HID58_042610 [Brassica napus]|uniref:Sorting nexin/Vps5-like C-terminal domain-containing protein n=1 Tax=Brassica napus TaxID=3708 RepID=A0ABQ8BE60_BRANA|nr:hypothetical protein HID58_042610 [Brassica napus]
MVEVVVLRRAVMVAWFLTLSAGYGSSKRVEQFKPLVIKLPTDDEIEDGRKKVMIFFGTDWNRIKDVQSKVSDAVLGKEKSVEKTTPEYEKLKHYVFELENHLAEAQKHAYRLVKRHRELGQSLLDFGKAVKLLRACEGEPTGKAFSDLGTKSELLSIKLQKVAQQVLMNFEEPLKDYVRYVQSIKVIFSSFCLWD